MREFLQAVTEYPMTSLAIAGFVWFLVSEIVNAIKEKK